MRQSQVGVTRRNGPAGRARTLSVVAAVLAVALAGLAFVVSGCTSGPPDEDSGIVGRITSVSPSGLAGDSGVTILVEAPAPDPSFVADKASVHVPEGTPVYDANGEKVGLNVLVVGAQVRVWFTGAVAESYPVQGQAKAVQLVATK